MRSRNWLLVFKWLFLRNKPNLSVSTLITTWHVRLSNSCSNLLSCYTHFHNVHNTFVYFIVSIFLNVKRSSYLIMLLYFHLWVYFSFICHLNVCSFELFIYTFRSIAYTLNKDMYDNLLMNLNVHCVLILPMWLPFKGPLHSCHSVRWRVLWPASVIGSKVECVIGKQLEWQIIICRHAVPGGFQCLSGPMLTPLIVITPITPPKQTVVTEPHQKW